MRNLNLYLIVFLGLLAGCGGGGGGSDSTPPAPVRPAGTVQGVGFDGLILNGQVVVKAFDDCVVGDVLATTTTDSQGLYSLEIISADKPIILEITGGRYIEEATGRNVPLQVGQKLRAVTNYESGNTIHVSMTYYTNLAAGLAEYLSGTGVPCNVAINTANQRMGDLIGIDIIGVTPVDVSDPDSASASLTNEIGYGMQTAAISKFTEWASAQNSSTAHSIYNSIFFAQKAYEDVKSDGLLNGAGINGLVSVGIVPLDVEVYRHSLALNMLAMANSARNATGLPVSAFVNLASNFNNSDDALFGGVPVITFDGEIPSITNLSISDGDVVGGTLTLSADVTDTSGLSSVNFYLDNVLIGTASDLTTPSLTYDTIANSVTDGSHVFRIEAINVLSNTSAVDINVIISNTGTSISNVSPANGALVRGTFTLSATVTDPVGVSSVEFNVDGGNSQFAPSPSAPSVDINSALFVDGAHDFNIIATNSVGSQTISAVVYTVDNTIPDVAIDNLVDGQYLRGDGNILTGVINDLNGISSAQLFLAGQLIDTFVTFPDVNSVIDTVGLLDGSKSLVLTATDMAGNTNSSTRNVYVDNTAPAVNISFPQSNDSVNSSFDIVATVNDNLNVAQVEFRIDGAHYAYAANPTLPRQTVNISQFSDGAHTIEVIATDGAGNTASAISSNVMFDTQAPNVTVVPGANDPSLARWNCHVTISTSDGNYPSSSGIDRVVVTNLTNNSATTHFVGGGGGAFDYVFSTQSTSTGSLNVTSFDGANNSRSITQCLRVLNPAQGQVDRQRCELC